LQIVGIDETSLRRGQHYITVVHDLDAKRLLFATEGRDHQTVLDFAADLKAHGGDPAEVRHVCMDMSAAYAKGRAQALPQAPPSATTASTSSRSPSRRWTTCGARKSGRSAAGRGPQDAAKPVVGNAQEPGGL
jgi:hypothetical protein